MKRGVLLNERVKIPVTEYLHTCTLHSVNCQFYMSPFHPLIVCPHSIPELFPIIGIRVDQAVL